jgi:hypothetical protein
METIPLNFINQARFTQEIHAVKQAEVNKNLAPFIIGAIVIGTLVIYYLHQQVLIPQCRDRQDS